MRMVCVGVCVVCVCRKSTLFQPTASPSLQHKANVLWHGLWIKEQAAGGEWNDLCGR